jgi:hypothetical protein
MGQTRSILRTLRVLLSVIVLTACQTDQGQNSTPTRPASLIQWDGSPSNIVFQADVVGGPQDITRVSEVPLCTIYGDNRVVWVNELDAFHVEILYDYVDDVAIEDFVVYLTVQERIYTYEAHAAEQEIGDLEPVVETVSINVNGQMHTADAFSGWDSQWFARVVRACKRISQSPILFEPNGAWLTVQVADYNFAAPTVNWNAQGANLSLAEVANSGQPRWIEDSNVVVLWNYLNTLPSNLLFLENNLFHQIAVQVPGISRISPPPP